jgi:hypothetical protein
LNATYYVGGQLDRSDLGNSISLSQTQDTHANRVFSNQEQYQDFAEPWSVVRQESASGPWVREGSQKPILFIIMPEFVGNVQVVVQCDDTPPFGHQHDLCGVDIDVCDGLWYLCGSSLAEQKSSGQGAHLDARLVKRSRPQTSFEQRSKSPDYPTCIFRRHIWSIRHGDVCITIFLSADLQYIRDGGASERCGWAKGVGEYRMERRNLHRRTNL